MLKKFLKKHLVVTTAVALVLSVGAVTVFATNGFGLFDGQISIDNVENLTVNNPTPTTDVVAGSSEDTLFGGSYSEVQNDIATSTTKAIEVNNLSIYDRLRFGDNPTINQNAVTYKYLFSNFADATTTPFAVQNKEGKNIFLVDWGIELTGMATNTMQMFLGTTSNGMVPADNATQRAISNPDNTLTSLSDNILITDGGIYDATSTVIFFTPTYNPAVTHGYGAYMGATPVKPGQYINLYASSTSDVNSDIAGSANLFDGKIWLLYKFWE